MPISVTGFHTITVTMAYQNAITGAGEVGTIEFHLNVPALQDNVDKVTLTTPTYVAVLPGTIGSGNNTAGTGQTSIVIPTTDNNTMFPAGTTYTIIERVSNLGNRVTKGVQIPSTLGSTVALTDVLKNYLT